MSHIARSDIPCDDTNAVDEKIYELRQDKEYLKEMGMSSSRVEKALGIKKKDARKMLYQGINHVQTKPKESQSKGNHYVLKL
jgi:hypothetical protein